MLNLKITIKQVFSNDKFLGRPITIFLCVLLLLIESCKPFDMSESLDFVSHNDGLKVLNLLDSIDKNKIKYLGDYEYKKKTVISSLEFDKTYSADVIKIDNVSESLKFKIIDSEGLSYQPRWYDLIRDDKNRIEIMYDPLFNKKKQLVSSIDLILNGRAIKIKSGKNFNSYLLDSESFGICVNKEKGSTIGGKMQKKQIAFTLLLQKKCVYFFITSLNDGSEFNNKDLQYLFGKYLRFKKI